MGDTWEKRFSAYIKEKPEANELFVRLLFGADPVLLMRLSAAVTDGSAHGLEQYRRELKATGTKFRNHVPDVLATANLIESLNNGAENWKIRHFTELPEKLREYAKCLEAHSRMALKLSSERLPKTTDYGLYFLYAYVLKATGRPQWRGLAMLLEAAYAASGVSRDVDDELIRKKIMNLRAREPQRCYGLERKAEEYINGGNGGWPSGQDFRQIAEEIVLEFSEENHPETNSSE